MIRRCRIFKYCKRNANNIASFYNTRCSALVTPPNPTPCGAIDIASIDTYDGESSYILNGNHTITECQILKDKY